MTTNKPGSVNQQPLFGCIICYEHVTYPADHLRVYNGECWCESCWEYATHEITDGLDWGELEPFRPVLNTEYEKLQTEYEQLVSYTKNGIECFANPCPEHSGVNTPPFSEFQERYGQLCLMCVVDERDTLRAECDELRAALAESRANDQQAMRYLNQARKIVGGDDFPDMVRRCDKLRKDAERYRWLRRGGNDDIGVVMGFDGIDCGSTSVAYTYEEGLCGERMDAAIDDAMETTQ